MSFYYHPTVKFCTKFRIIGLCADKVGSDTAANKESTFYHDPPKREKRTQGFEELQRITAVYADQSLSVEERAKKRKNIKHSYCSMASAQKGNCCGIRLGKKEDNQKRLSNAQKQQKEILRREEQGEMAGEAEIANGSE